jgi:predicted AAA+ superfamily ATPase
VENDIYQKLLSDKAHVNLGYLYENITAQMLVAQGYRLYYYTFPKENTRLHYEVDFLIPERSKIIPIEVKSSGYRTHASLDAFEQKFSSRISRRLLVYTKNLQKDRDVIFLPVYLLPFLRETIALTM